MSLYERNERFRGALFRDTDETPTVRMPRVLRGAQAAMAHPAEDGPTLLPKVLRGNFAQHTVRAFEVATMVPTPLYEVEASADDAPPVFEPANYPPHAAPPAPAADEQAIRADEAMQWQAKMEEAAVRARENGYKHGYADGEKAAEDHHTLLREAIARELTPLHDAWRAHFKTMETEVAALAFEVAEAILGAPLPDNVRLVSSRALQEAVESFGKAPLLATLHPVDLLRLQETGIEAELRRHSPDLRLDADPFLNEGDWHIETDTTSVRRVRDELLDTLRRRLGLLGLGK